INIAILIGVQINLSEHFVCKRNSFCYLLQLMYVRVQLPIFVKRSIQQDRKITSILSRLSYLFKPLNAVSVFNAYDAAYCKCVRAVQHIETWQDGIFLFP